MTNLIEILSFVLADSNESEMKMIVNAANDWCRKKIIRAEIMTDILKVLLHYAHTLDSFDRSWREKWLTRSLSFILKK